MLGNAEQAIVAWNVVLAGQPARTCRRCARWIACTWRAGDFRELADNLQRQLKLAEDDPHETVALLGRLGALREQQLGELGAAVDTYRKILELEPEHPETIAALERILPNPEHELDVAQLLEPIYQVARRLAAPDRASTRSRRATPPIPSRRSPSTSQIADGYEVGLDDPDRAYEALGARAGARIR